MSTAHVTVSHNSCPQKLTTHRPRQAQPCTQQYPWARGCSPAHNNLAMPVKVAITDHGMNALAHTHKNTLLIPEVTCMSIFPRARSNSILHTSPHTCGTSHCSTKLVRHHHARTHLSNSSQVKACLSPNRTCRMSTSVPRPTPYSHCRVLHNQDQMLKLVTQQQAPAALPTHIIANPTHWVVAQPLKGAD